MLWMKAWVSSTSGGSSSILDPRYCDAHWEKSFVIIKDESRIETVGC